MVVPVVDYASNNYVDTRVQLESCTGHQIGA